ncbi:hypothetical protein L3i20_v216560 [Paenibacillus sp. L3-i20]|nr:hypothetical protein [Paenibacillus sp. L3-i20]GKU77259.1 hypothetical protein L3i20_v216560 [Paenibacillus sp. L3-i20]
MDSFAIVEKLNVSVDFRIGLFTCFKFLAIVKFFLENAVKGLYAGVVVTIASATHTGVHIVRSEFATIRFGGVLDSAIGVMNKTFAW